MVKGRRRRGTKMKRTTSVISTQVVTVSQTGRIGSEAKRRTSDGGRGRWVGGDNLEYVSN